MRIYGVKSKKFTTADYSVVNYVLKKFTVRPSRKLNSN